MKVTVTVEIESVHGFEFTATGEMIRGSRAPNPYEMDEDDYVELESITNEDGENVTELLDEEQVEHIKQKLEERANDN